MKYFFTFFLILALVKSYAQKQRYSKDELKRIVAAQQTKINDLLIQIESLSDLQKKYLKADRDKFDCMNRFSDSVRVKNDMITRQIQENQYLRNYVKTLKDELVVKNQTITGHSQLIQKLSPSKAKKYSLYDDESAPVHNKYSRRTYITGPRGGCYYINGNGNKTYVDRSLCN
jgi:hypothetical protein